MIGLHLSGGHSNCYSPAQAQQEQRRAARKLHGLELQICPGDNEPKIVDIKRIRDQVAPADCSRNQRNKKTKAAKSQQRHQLMGGQLQLQLVRPSQSHAPVCVDSIDVPHSRCFNYPPPRPSGFYSSAGAVEYPNELDAVPLKLPSVAGLQLRPGRVLELSAGGGSQLDDSLGQRERRRHYEDNNNNNNNQPVLLIIQQPEPAKGRARKRRSDKTQAQRLTSTSICQPADGIPVIGRRVAGPNMSLVGVAGASRTGRMEERRRLARGTDEQRRSSTSGGLLMLSSYERQLTKQMEATRRHRQQQQQQQQQQLQQVAELPPPSGFLLLGPTTSECCGAELKCCATQMSDSSHRSLSSGATPPLSSSASTSNGMSPADGSVCCVCASEPKAKVTQQQQQQQRRSKTSSSQGSRRTSAPSGGRDDNTRAREQLEAREREEAEVSQMYESLAAELKAKLGNPKRAPILLPPKDYDTLQRQQGKFQGIELRRSTNPKLVGPIERQQQQQSDNSTAARVNEQTRKLQRSRSDSSSGLGSISPGHTHSPVSSSASESSCCSSAAPLHSLDDQRQQQQQPRDEQAASCGHRTQTSYNGRVEVPLKVNCNRKNGNTYLATKQIIY